MKRFLLFTCLAATLRADFSYDETSRITGGAIVGMMKFAGVFSKNARKVTEPIVSTTAVKGNRLVHKSAERIEIIDLDRETITQINPANRTYSVVTFAQMKQAMEDASKKMQDAGKPNTSNLEYEVSVRETGQTRTIAGRDARETIVTISVKGADPNSGQRGALDVKSDMWIAPKVAGYEEIQRFYLRMAKKLDWGPGSPMGMARPDMAKAMGQVYKEGSKLNGIPVYTVTTMGGSAEGMPVSDSRQDTRQSAPPPGSVSDAVGGAIAGRLGLGGFGRKKPKQDQTQDAPPAGGNASGSLMEMTMEVTSFSPAPVDPAWFEVPAGYSQVQESLSQPDRRRR